MKKSSSRKQVKKPTASGITPPDEENRFLLRGTLTGKNIELIEPLVVAAKEGNEDYAYALYHLAWFATMNLQVIVDPKRDFARKLAPFVNSWPILVSPSANYLATIPEFVKEVELGTKFDDPLDATKVGHTKTESRQLALALIFLIDGMRKMHRFTSAQQQNEEALSSTKLGPGLTKKTEKYSANIQFYKRNSANMLSQCKMALQRLAVLLRINQQVEQSEFASWGKQALALPDLTKKSIEGWVSVGMQIIFSLTGEHPEDNAVLRELGKYKLEYFYRKEAKRRLCVEKITDPKVLALAKKLEADGVALKSAHSFLYEGIATRLTDACSKMLRAKANNNLSVGG